VHVPPMVFRDYPRSIIEHFIKFGQRRFVIVMGHGGHEMKNSVAEACNSLCRNHDVAIVAFYIAYILEELNLVNTFTDKHVEMWKTSIIMAIDSSLVRDLSLYRRIKPRSHY